MRLVDYVSEGCGPPFITLVSAFGNSPLLQIYKDLSEVRNDIVPWLRLPRRLFLGTDTGSRIIVV